MINISLLKNFSRAKKYLKSTAFDQTAGEMYIVLKGEVGLFADHNGQPQELIATVGPGDFFGEPALFLGKHSVAAKALTDVFVLPINKNTLTSFIKNEPDMVVELVKALCMRLDKVGSAYETLSGHPWVEPKPVPHSPADEKPSSLKASMNEAENKEQALSVAPKAKHNSESPQAFSLFPEGHGNYELLLNNQNRAFLMMKSYKCPLCKKEFKGQKVKSSQLVLENTDCDMRGRYKGIEPLYYDVVTCPHCLYSALAEIFDKPDRPGAGLLKQLGAIKTGTCIRSGADKDTFSIFAGYYLALVCAPKCFKSHALAIAKLYLKLSWIYKDCCDERMEEDTAARALDAYMNVYEKGDLRGSQEQQLCLIIAELSYKKNDMKNALDFFFKAKSHPSGTPLMKKRAEERIFEIRGL